MYDITRKIIAESKKHNLEAFVIAQDRYSVSCESENTHCVENIHTRREHSFIIRLTNKNSHVVSITSLQSPDHAVSYLESMRNVLRYAPKSSYCVFPPAQLMFRRIVDESTISDYLHSSVVDNLSELARNSNSLDISGVKQSQSSSCFFKEKSFFCSTSGFSEKSVRASFSVFCESVVSDQKNNMEVSYAFDTAINLQLLKDPKKILHLSCTRAKNKLGGKKIKSGSMHTILSSRSGDFLINILLSAVNGESIIQKKSFLLDKMNTIIMKKNISIVDKPHIQKSTNFFLWDDEGVSTNNTYIIRNGYLRNWITNYATALQLKTQTTGHADYQSGSPQASSYNVHVINHELLPPSIEEMIVSYKEGIVIEEYFSPAINNLSGDFSLGVSGYFFSGGERVFPVKEITISGNIQKIFHNMVLSNKMEVTQSLSVPDIYMGVLDVSGI